MPAGVGQPIRELGELKALILRLTSATISDAVNNVFGDNVRLSGTTGRFEVKNPDTGKWHELWAAGPGPGNVAPTLDQTEQT